MKREESPKSWADLNADERKIASQLWDANFGDVPASEQWDKWTPESRVERYAFIKWAEEECPDTAARQILCRSLEEAFLEWQALEDARKEMERNTTDADKLGKLKPLFDSDDATIRALRAVFNKKENWSRLDPDKMFPKPRLSQEDRIRAFVEQRKAEDEKQERMPQRKLTITRTEDGKPTTRTVAYDGKPECLYNRTGEYTDNRTRDAIFGCHVVWCYYRIGKRVATVVVDRGNGEIKPSDANRLERCWPERIEIVSISEQDKRLGDSWDTAGQAWLTDGTQSQERPLELAPYFEDEVFIHPDDDGNFDGTTRLTGTDRVRIVDTDKAHLRPPSNPEPTRKLTLEERLLFKIATECPKLDMKTRKPLGHRKTGSHWEVFIAAWRERLTPYHMAREKGWNRRTAQGRLTAVEHAFLGNQKVEDLAFDSTLLNSVEAQLRSAHEHNATIHRPDLLDNTTSANDEE